MSIQPEIRFCSGVGSVTGANFLLDVPSGKKILVDCGLIQGEDAATRENHDDFSYDPSTIDCLLVTHAHLDHVGRIPLLVKNGFAGTIYSTPETKALAELVLNDAVGILAMEATRQGIDPLYDPNDVPPVFDMWKTVPYHEAFTVADDTSIFFKDAGHILGSSMIEVRVKNPSGGSEWKILFTGDLGNSPAPLLRDTESIGSVEYLVMESVYGDRNHEDREERLNTFERVIKESIQRGGTLIIPAFSLDRTQVLLYELNNLVEQKRIPSVPVYVDSPMAIKATSVYKSSTDLFNDQVRGQIKAGDNVFAFPHLQYTTSQSQSQDIERRAGAKIILAGSGMSVGGRVISHEAHYLPDANNTILLVGYQSVGSLGRHLADGAGSVTIHGQKVPVKAKIETLYGFSAHKDSDHLLEFVSTADDNLTRVFVVMGEPRASMYLAQRINDELGVSAIVPERNRPYRLE